MEAMQKALDDSLVDETKRKPENAVYVLNFRYTGACSDTKKLEKGLNSLGWLKVADLTSLMWIAVYITMMLRGF